MKAEAKLPCLSDSAKECDFISFMRMEYCIRLRTYTSLELQLVVIQRVNRRRVCYVFHLCFTLHFRYTTDREKGESSVRIVHLPYETSKNKVHKFHVGRVYPVGSTCSVMGIVVGLTQTAGTGVTVTSPFLLTP
jgi:hypothetical protein